MADFVVDVGVVDDAGAEVVVVLVVFEDDEDDERAVVVPLEVEEAVGELAVVVLAVPGCSFATRTPMSASDAVAATTTDCVIRRRRTCARWRDRGELRSAASSIMHSLSSDEVMKPSLPFPHPLVRLAPAVIRSRNGFSQTAISQLTTKGDSRG